MEKTILNLNGCKLANSQPIWDDSVDKKVWSLISVRGGSKLVLSGDGEVLALADDCYAADVRNGGHLVIEDGKFNGNITAIYVLEGTLEIKGGEFDVQQLSNFGDKRYMLNCFDANYKNGTAKIIVSGGKFHDFDPGNNLAEGPETNFLAPGYKSVDLGDGWFEAVAE